MYTEFRVLGAANQTRLGLFLTEKQMFSDGRNAYFVAVMNIRDHRKNFVIS